MSPTNVTKHINESIKRKSFEISRLSVTALALRLIRRQLKLTLTR